MTFTLSFLFSVFILVALSLAVFGPCGIVFAAILLAIVGYVRGAESRWRAVRNVVLIFGSLLLVLLLLPLISGVRGPYRRAQCWNNLHQIGLALCQYRALHGALPPIRECESGGRLLHSWRVRMLPALAFDSLFQQYNWNEPWNGPRNSKLTSDVPDVYACPNDWVSWKHGATSYVAVVDRDGDWLKTEQCGRESATPVRVVEMGDSGVPWMAPRDISFEDYCKAILQPSTSGQLIGHKSEIDGLHHDQPVGVHALFADGTVRTIRPGIPEDMLRAALLGDRQKLVELDAYCGKRLNWPRLAALAGLVLWFIVVLAWPRTQGVKGKAGGAAGATEPNAKVES